MLKLKTRDVVISGILGGISIFLGQTGLGFIPLPTGINATIMHVPVIIGAIMEGPVVGTFVGFIFGFFSFIQPRVPFFADPLISILPRLFIGVVTYYVFVALRRFNGHVALVTAGVIGSLTNTVLVLGMINLRGYLPWETVTSVALINGLPEAIVAGIITYFVSVGVKKSKEEEI